MTQTEILFIRTLEDTQQRLRSKDPYEILCLSALIRKLFLDDYPLVDQVNRLHRQRITFEISDPDSPYARLIKGRKPTFYSVQDGLNPEKKLTVAAKLNVNRDKFFAVEVLLIEDVSYSVRDVVLFEANIMGGVHAGTPKTEKEKALAEIGNLYKIGGVQAALRQLISIAEVIVKALAPLRKTVEGAA